MNILGVSVELGEKLRALHSSCNPPCITKRCKRNRCTWILPREGIVCIDCDICCCFSREIKKPDFIILYTGDLSDIPRWFIVEMKGRVADVGDITQQLQIGVSVVQSNQQFKVFKSSHRLDVLLLYDRHVHAADFARKPVKVRFGRKSLDVVKKRCGSMLIGFL